VSGRGRKADKVTELESDNVIYRTFQPSHGRIALDGSHLSASWIGVRRRVGMRQMR